MDREADLCRMIKEIKELLEHEWQVTNQEAVNAGIMGYERIYSPRCEYIRYLQDQVNKITKEVDFN